MYSIIIKGGKIVDGTGNPWFYGDIGIKNGKISKIDRLHSEAEKVIDAEGCIISPGFIDMHSHSDLTPLINPYMESKVRQGVTTEVIGNCGFSAAPLNDRLREQILETSPMLKEADAKLEWSSTAEYMEVIERNGVSLNLAPLVGHGTLRAFVMGYEKRRPTSMELEQMKRLLAESLEQGAFGMSTGLIYPPSCYAETEEIIELCKVVAKYGGIYSSHIRGEEHQLLDSVKEAIEIGEKAKVPVEISHHKAAGRENWGKVKETLRMIEEARGLGVEVTCDVYPYTAGSFGLDSILPPYAHEGGVKKMLEKLKDPESRRKLRNDMVKGVGKWRSVASIIGWENIMISYCKGHPEYEGKMISELAGQKSVDPFDFVFDLIIEEKSSTSVVLFSMSEDDMRRVLKSPFSMIGSDSSARAAYGILAAGKPHPRAYGTFPRVLGRYVREEKVLTLQDAIRKMTSFPAQKLGLKDRGLIKEGMWADITIFNPRKITDKATFTAPHQYPEGIKYVIINGKIVIEKGEHTKEKPGKVLRRAS
ncbi:MAG TPA: D-aminoacylase [Candidatus Bathyarchaeota archaeon]|nr:D-aminoacylase [Candidatus Bathyarchaeota archaeon]